MMILRTKMFDENFVIGPGHPGEKSIHIKLNACLEILTHKKASMLKKHTQKDLFCFFLKTSIKI